MPKMMKIHLTGAQVRLLHGDMEGVFGSTQTTDALARMGVLERDGQMYRLSPLGARLVDAVRSCEGGRRTYVVTDPRVM